MSEASTAALRVVIEREIPHPPERVWRALTQPSLIEEWLMQSDFEPVVGHRFGFRAEWGVIDCRVLEAEPYRALSYSWAALGLQSVVTWTLTPTSAGTRLRMEQSGFRPEQRRAYLGARSGWQRYVAALEQVVAGHA